MIEYTSEIDGAHVVEISHAGHLRVIVGEGTVFDQDTESGPDVDLNAKSFTEEDYVEIYSVQVEGRMDGLYLFSDDDSAARFAAAVEQDGGTAIRTNEPLNGPNSAEMLIAAELSTDA